ncbi:hypothetical protein AALO_G00274430 [Alosa alosa]|uniref:Uncharacterized protein n=1 Tax=Alosa alosa TaxID=278164 RepID=A0AAV6FHU8_9TELE|nr:hypothetical protein AALO_G00274430 [Alosa alosa]
MSYLFTDPNSNRPVFGPTSSAPQILSSKSCDLGSGEAVILTQKPTQSQAPVWSLPSQECMQCCHQDQCGDAPFYAHPYRLQYNVTPQSSLWCSSGEPPPPPALGLLSDDVCPVMVSMVVAGIPVVPAADGTIGKVLAAAHRFIRFERAGRHIKNSPRQPATPAPHFISTHRDQTQ